MEFALALSGGGVRGATHVGVICALEENGLYPNSVSGTSAGSIVAGLYAMGYSGKMLCEVIEDIYSNRKYFLDYDIFGLLKCACSIALRGEPCFTGVIKGNVLEEYINLLTSGARISECKMDILIPTVDIMCGETVIYTNYEVFKSGVCEYIFAGDERLSKIIRASCAVPAVFRPKLIGERVLVDGGVTNNLPVDIMKMNGCKNIIAVDITSRFVKPDKINIMSVSYTAFNIMSSCLKELTSTGEVLNISPILPKEATLLNFDEMLNCMEAGYEYTIKLMPSIKALFGSQNVV